MPSIRFNERCSKIPRAVLTPKGVLLSILDTSCPHARCAGFLALDCTHRAQISDLRIERNLFSTTQADSAGVRSVLYMADRFGILGNG